MGDLLDFEDFRARKLNERDKDRLPKEDVLVYTDLSGVPQCVPYGQPVTLQEWDLMPSWIKGMYQNPS